MTALSFTRRWLVPCWCLLGLSRLVLRVVPFRRLKGWLGESSGGAPWIPLATDDQMSRALLIGRAVSTLSP